MVEIGQAAPTFTLEDVSGERVSLEDFRGKQVVLYFYPKDMTPGCTTQACDFRDHMEDFSALNTVIIGVSLIRFQDMRNLRISITFLFIY